MISNPQKTEQQLREEIRDQLDITPFLISNAHFIEPKNKKKCKINSRNFTYDGLTFSCSSFVMKQVKDEI